MVATSPNHNIRRVSHRNRLFTPSYDGPSYIILLTLRLSVLGNFRWSSKRIWLSDRISDSDTCQRPQGDTSQIHT
jgi:hypothetical protein